MNRTTETESLAAPGDDQGNRTEQTRPVVIINANPELGARRCAYRFTSAIDLDEVWPNLCQEISLALAVAGITAICQRSHPYWSGGEGARLDEIAFPCYARPGDRMDPATRRGIEALTERALLSGGARRGDFIPGPAPEGTA
jgi:hypothetical protein